MDALIELLSSSSKHQRYQSLPPELLTKFPELEKYCFKNRFDESRFDWFTTKLDFTNKRVVDIGANVGYFSFRLNQAFNASISAYEINAAHLKAVERMRELLQITDDKFKGINEGVALEDIQNLPEHDICLLFNVLHHAGDDFDGKYVKKIEDWGKYAVQYLNEIRKKSTSLVYQVGRKWLGNKGFFCDDEEMVSFHRNIIEKAGWHIQNIGVVNEKSGRTYIDYTDGDKYPLIKDNSKLTKIIWHYLKMNRYTYPFLIRPIFICKRDNG